MSKERVYILGAGGMAREVKSYYEYMGKGNIVEGFVEQNSQRSGILLQFLQVKPRTLESINFITL